MLCLATHLLQDLSKTLLSSFIYKTDQQKSFSLSVLKAFVACHCLRRTWGASEGCSRWFPHPAFTHCIQAQGVLHSMPPCVTLGRCPGCPLYIQR